MKWTVLVLSLLVVFSNHLKAAAQQNTSNLSSVVMSTSSQTISLTSDNMTEATTSMPIMSDSSINMTIDITNFTVTMADISTTDMTLTMEVTNTLVAIESTPTSTSTFMMTVTTMLMPTTTTTMFTTSMPPSTSTTEPTTSISIPSTSIPSIPSPTDDGEGDDEGLGTGVIIGIAAGGGAALVVLLVIFIICCCCCYQKRHREESYNIGPTVTARYWDANHPNDAGPGHVTSGGSMRSRTSWRDSLRSFTRGSLRRSLSLRRSSKRAKDKQQPSEYIGLYSTPL